MAALLFGSTFLVVKGALHHAGPLPFLGVRFLVAAGVLGPVALSRRARATDGELRHGFYAGSALLAGFVLQTIGLRYTTASSSAFVTYLLVVLVPVIVAVIDRRWPTGATVMAVLLAAGGLLLLSGGPSGFGIGEVLTLGGAFAFAVHIIVLSRTAARHDALRLTFWQVLVVALVCIPAGLFSGGYHLEGSVWLGAAFCGVGATAGAFFLMVWAQRVVPPARAALILLLEPVFAAVLGFTSGERLGWAGACGAGAILVAILVAEVVPAVLTRSGLRATLAR